MALLPVNQARDGPNPPDVGAIAQHCMFYPTSRVVLGDDSFFSSSDSLASFKPFCNPTQLLKNQPANQLSLHRVNKVYSEVCFVPVGRWGDIALWTPQILPSYCSFHFLFPF